MAVFFYSFNDKILSMKHLKHIVLPLLVLFLSSCTTNANTDSSGEPNNNSNSDNNNPPYVNPYKVMNEPLINRQHYLNHIGDIYNTWNSYRGKGVTIAVIDVGFMANHPDFTYSDGSSKVSNKSAYIYTTGAYICRRWNS